MKNTLNFICKFVGEAMGFKKIIYILMLVPMLFFAQDIRSLKQLSDDQLVEYWNDAQKQGYTIDQLKILAKTQGMSDAELKDLEQRLSDISNVSSNKLNASNSKDLSSQTSFFGLNEKKDKNINPLSLVFGSNFFNNPNITITPQLNVATPSSYEIGPGDELLISLWGAAENEYNATVSREGFLKIERIGPVYVSGLTITEAKSKLKLRLSKIYSGLKSNYNKVFFDLSLLNTRSIIINIAGNVAAPGTYTLSSLTSPLNAIYAAGGPSENGSYREINIIRGGEKVHSIDLYDYFVKGELKNFSLRDQDIILVPTYKKRVFLNGEFKTNGIFELKDKESISDLLFYNGGISSSGVKNTVLINRVDGVSKRIETVEKEIFENYVLKDGDIIEARKVGDEIKNAVFIEGHVMIPGQYELNKNLDVRALIKSAGGLKEGAQRDRAYLIREVDGFQQEVISINLRESINLKENYSLKANDNLIIASIEELTSQKKISISGEVNEPGSFPFFDGSTVADLILMAKGITDKGSDSEITIYRSTYDKTQKTPVETINIDLSESVLKLSSNKNIKLMVNDLVVVRSKLGYQSKEFVSVRGLVKKEGDYALKNNNYSVYDLIKDFNGFLPDAELDGIKIRRKSNLELLSSVKNDSIEVDSFIDIGLDIEKVMKSNGSLDQYNLVLKNGDEIIVPKSDNSIEISGQVQKPTALSYYKGLSSLSAINKAGGFTQNAKKSSVFVVYLNGDVASTRKFLFFNKYPKLNPGAKIIVPKKSDNKNKTSVGEIVGYTTSLVSIIALIKSL